MGPAILQREQRAASAAQQCGHDKLVALGSATAQRGADTAAFLFLREHSIGIGTVQTYGAHWMSFANYCLRRRLFALPALTDTIGDFVLYKWVTGPVAAVLLKPMHAATRKRHVAAGFINLCDDARIREAKQGFRVAALEHGGHIKTQRLPLSETDASRLAAVAAACPERAPRHRLTLRGGDTILADAAGDRRQGDARGRRRGAARRVHQQPREAAHDRDEGCR